MATVEERPQHMQALERANSIRLRRAEIKRQVASGALTVEEVIIEPPEEALNMTIAELLGAQRRWGTTRTAGFLADIGMPETKTLGSLTERQRSVLCALGISTSWLEGRREDRETVLAALQRHPDGVSCADLAAEVGFSLNRTLGHLRSLQTAASASYAWAPPQVVAPAAVAGEGPGSRCDLGL